MHGTAVLAAPEEARAVARGDQEIVLCGRCGLVFNRAFEPAKLDYAGEHSETQHHSPRFAEYARDLSAGWVQRYGLAGRDVVEVGCGGGDFAAALLDAGVGRVTGIDPHFTPGQVPPERAGRLVAVPEYFAAGMVAPGTAAVVCRHTLEHIPELALFGAEIMRGIRSAGVPVFLAEVPDLERILRTGAFWDLQYEHCSYFTSATLAGYLRGLGLDVVASRTTYSDQYLVADAAPGASCSSSSPCVADVTLEQLHKLCASFAEETTARIAMWASWLDERAAAGQPVAVWGGGAKGLTFLNVLAGHAGPVTGVVDINPGLQRHYIGGVGLRIQPPAELPAAPPHTVLLMNPVYRQEVRDQLDALGLASTTIQTMQ